MVKKNLQDKDSTYPSKIAGLAQVIADPTLAESPIELKSSLMPINGLLEELRDDSTMPPLPIAIMEQTLRNPMEIKSKGGVDLVKDGDGPAAFASDSLDLGVDAVIDKKKNAEAFSTVMEDEESQGPPSNNNSSTRPPRTNQPCNATAHPSAVHGTTWAVNNDTYSNALTNSQRAGETDTPLASYDPGATQAVISLEATVQEITDIPEAFLVDDDNVVTGIPLKRQVPWHRQRKMKFGLAAVCTIVIVLSIALVCWVGLKSSSGSGGKRKPGGGSDVFYCGCTLCTDSVLDKDADGLMVRSRIEWLTSEMGKSEEVACSTVCGREFPMTCGQCNPNKCGDGDGESG